MEWEEYAAELYFWMLSNSYNTCNITQRLGVDS